MSLDEILDSIFELEEKKKNHENAIKQIDTKIYDFNSMLRMYRHEAKKQQINKLENELISARQNLSEDIKREG